MFFLQLHLLLITASF